VLVRWALHATGADRAAVLRRSTWTRLPGAQRCVEESDAMVGHWLLRLIGSSLAVFLVARIMPTVRVRSLLTAV